MSKGTVVCRVMRRLRSLHGSPLATTGRMSLWLSARLESVRACDCSESCVLVEPDPASRVLKRENQGVIVTGCLQNRLCRDSVKVSVEIVRGFSVA